MGRTKDLRMLERAHSLQRISRGFYQNIPGERPDFFSWSRHESIPFPLVGSNTIDLGFFKIPTQMVLDLTSVVFKMILQGPGNTFTEAGDWYAFQNARYTMKVDGRIPWDQTFDDPSGNTAQSGFVQANSNIFTADDDTKFHLTLNEGQRVSFEAVVSDAAGFAPPNGSRVFVSANGVWITKTVWNAMKEDLR